MESSTEPLSEMITSKSVACVPSKMDRRQSRITRRSFQQMITTESFICRLPVGSDLRLYLYNSSLLFEGLVSGFQHSHYAQSRLAVVEGPLVIANAIDEVRSFHFQ